MSTRIHELAVGRWHNILPQLGVPSDLLTGKHTGCPICKAQSSNHNGLAQSFRFDNKAGRGTWICARCGAGSGIDLVMMLHGVQFAEAKRMIEPLIERAAFTAPRVQRDVDPAKHLDRWRHANPLSGDDPASRYLAKRGVLFEKPPSQLRWVSNARFYPDFAKSPKTFTEHPAMIALFVSPDRVTTMVHTTYLTLAGDKADLGRDGNGVPLSVKRFARGKIPEGGAIRLANSAPTMGIAEGIENALAAMRLDGLPVWAGGNADQMLKWKPPENAKHIVIYGDRDASFTGQYKAYGLAYRLKAMGLAVDVRLPPSMGDDWNDVLMAEKEVVA